jgi:hypothetical protein
MSAEGRSPLEKKKRETDPEYVKWIHEWECVVFTCGRPWPVHAHHTKTRGAGGSDYSCIPLCPVHHLQVHNKGVKTFQAMHKADFEALTKVFYKMWSEGKHGPNAHEIECLASSSFRAS